MDPKDAALLNLLQNDASLTLERLADAVSLSVPAVQRRIKRLRNSGVIKGNVIIVDPVAVDMSMTFVLIVELERDRSEHIESFRRKAIKEPLVQQCYYVTGEGDFVIISIAKNMDDFEAMTHRLLFEDSNVRGFKTSISMGKSYKTLYVPIEAT